MLSGIGVTLDLCGVTEVMQVGEGCDAIGRDGACQQTSQQSHSHDGTCGRQKIVE